MDDAWWKSRIESDPEVKAWTENNVAVVCKNEGVTPCFLHLTNLNDRTVNYRGHALKPHEIYFTKDRWILARILGRDAGPTIMPTAVSSVPLPPVSVKASPQGRYIKLRKANVGT